MKKAKKWSRATEESQKNTEIEVLGSTRKNKWAQCHNRWDNNQDFFFQIVSEYIQFQRDVLFTVKLSSEN